MINIGTFGTKTSNGTTTRVTTGSGSGGLGSLFNPVYLWGQYFDDSEDINGDMEVKGDIRVEGDISAYGIQADKMNVLKLEADELEAKNFKADAANITDLEASNLKADKAELLNALIKELSATNLVAENLTVTKGAHFFELIIDKIKAAGGAVLFTPADGFKIDKVEPNAADNEIKLYFRATDGEKKKKNMWQKNDQARCQNFNQAKQGTNYNLDNKYFWTLVKNTNNELNDGNPVEVNLGTEELPDMQECHYIIISTKAGEFEGLVNPEVDDEIVMLGHRGEDVDRQAAIYIAAYSSIDEDLKAPLFVQYAGINDFNLYSHKFNWFSAGVTGQGAVRGIKPNTISGDVRIGGQSIEDYIDGKTGNIKTYRLMPYTNNIMIDKSGNMSPSSVTVKILYNANSEITTLDNVPDMMKVDVYGVNEDGTETSNPTLTFSAGNPISITSSTVRQYSYIYCVLKATTNDTVYDRCSISIIEDTSNQDIHGGHWEFAYKLHNSKTAPTKPDDGTSVDNLTNGWTKDIPTPTDSNPYVYMSQCFVSGTGVYGSWSNPLRINGENGKPGEDGKDIEYVYCRTTSDAQISAPASNSTLDWPRTSTSDHAMSNSNIWYDNPQGVDSTHRYEWVSMRTVKGTTFGDYSTPAIWSVYGSKGMDGDGYEYIYKLLTTNTFSGTEPKNISTAASDSVGKSKSDDDFVPEGWSDEPKEISSEERYCFVSTRKKHNGTWGDFTKPALWARYAEKGSDGGYYALIFKNSETNPGTPASSVTLDNLPTGWSKTATTPDKGKYTWMSQRYVVDGVYQGYWTYPIRITGADGENGKDGNNINFIYKRTTTNSKPSAPSYSSNATSDYQTNDDYTGASDSGWTKSPTGVDKNNMYEWVATRTKTDGKWGSYTVALWSKWGETGMDGDGVEYIFYLSNSSSAPDNPAPSNWSSNSSYQENDWYPTGWTDDPKAVTSSKPYQFVSQRKGHKGAWGKFSDPVLWSVYPSSSNGNNGSDGNDGENAKIDRIIDNGCYAEIKYNTSTKKFTLDYKIDFYIGHYDGGTLTIVSNSTTPNYSKYVVKWKWQNGTYNSISLSNLSTSVQHSETGLTWTKESGTNHRTHMIITLYDSNNKMLDQFIVQVLMKSEATLDVIQGESAAIISTVTGNVKNDLKGDMDNMSNSISQVEQTCNEIKGTVDNLEGQVSTISQKSDEISLTVEDQTDKLLKSGIDIKAGKIQISSSNTEIVGDLNVIEANKGFSVWNGNKAAQLRTNLLGKLNNYGFNGYVQYTEKNSSYKNKPSGDTYTLTIYHPMGSITAGSKVEAYYATLNIWDYYDNKNQFIWLGDASGNGKTISHYEVKAMIHNSYSNTSNPLKSTTQSKTATPNQTTRAFIAGLGLPSVEYTTNTTQTLYIIYEIKLYFIGEGTKQGAFEYRLDGGYSKEQDGMNFLTPDGAMFSKSYQEFFWSGYYNSFDRSGSDWSIFIRNKQQNFMISPLGIFRTKFNNSNSDSDFDDVISNKNIWGDISTTTPVYKSNSSSVDMTSTQNGCRLIDKYGILICTKNSGTCTWKLPDPSTCCGRIIHVKATQGASMKFTCTKSNAFIFDDNSEKMNECNIGGVASLFFCDGEYWIHHNSN